MNAPATIAAIETLVNACPDFTSTQRERCLSALRDGELNITRAAKILGIHRSTLHRRLRSGDVALEFVRSTGDRRAKTTSLQALYVKGGMA